MKKIILILILLIVSHTRAQEKFTDLDGLLVYASKNSLTLQSNTIKLTKAKKAKLAAVISILDPTGTQTLTFKNNTKLGVTLFPDENNPGKYNEIKLGQQYNTSIDQTLDIKLINFEGWERLKLAKINIDLTSSNSMITLKELQENIAANYYNIVSLQAQKVSAVQNQAVADTLYQIASNKYLQGQVKQQDVNDSKSAFLNAQENTNQIQYLIEQNYLSLKILCDIPEEKEITIENKKEDFSELFVPTVEENKLNVENSMLQEKYALRSLKQIKRSILPSLSFITNSSSQQYNDTFKLFEGTWYKSSYMGLKLSMPFPDYTMTSKKYNAKYEYELAKNSSQQAEIKSALEVKKLENEYSKNKSQFLSNKEVFALRKDTYVKNKNLYAEGLQSLENTLSSYNSMVNAEYSLISSRINVDLTLAKIDINNKIR